MAEGRGIAVAPLVRILKSVAGEEKIRISDDAKKKLKELVEKFTEILSRKAIEKAKEMKRLTIKPKDLEEAFKEIVVE